MGDAAQILDLRPARTWDDIVEMVAAKAEEVGPGEWIVGRGWHQSKWEQPPSPNVDGYPTDAAINKVAPNHSSGSHSFSQEHKCE